MKLLKAPESIVCLLEVAFLLFRNTDERSMPHHGQRVHCQDDPESRICIRLPQSSTSFHSVRLIILLAPFLKSSNVTEMFPSPRLEQFQPECCWHFMDSLQWYQRLMVTFAWRVKHLIFPSPKKRGYQRLISRVKFMSGCFFDIERTSQRTLGLTTFTLWKCYLALQAAVREPDGLLYKQREWRGPFRALWEFTAFLGAYVARTWRRPVVTREAPLLGC